MGARQILPRLTFSSFGARVYNPMPDFGLGPEFGSRFLGLGQSGPKFDPWLNMVSHSGPGHSGSGQVGPVNLPMDLLEVSGK